MITINMRPFAWQGVDRHITVMFMILSLFLSFFIHSFFFICFLSFSNFFLFFCFSFFFFFFLPFIHSFVHSLFVCLFVCLFVSFFLSFAFFLSEKKWKSRYTTDEKKKLCRQEGRFDSVTSNSSCPYFGKSVKCPPKLAALRVTTFLWHHNIFMVLCFYFFSLLVQRMDTDPTLSKNRQSQIALNLAEARHLEISEPMRVEKTVVLDRSPSKGE